MTPESILKRSICDYLAQFPDEFAFTLTPGVQAGKKKARSKYMPDGWPDITGVWRKRRIAVNAYGTIRHVVPFFIETKIRPRKPTDAQQEVLDRMNDWGCIAICAYELSDVVNRFYGHETHT